MGRGYLACALMGLVVWLGSPTAAAQDEQPTTSVRFPVRAIDRTPVLRAGIMSLGARGSYGHRRVFSDGLSQDPEQAIQLTPSLAYGVWDDFTVSATLFPVTFWPEDRLGNPNVGMRYRIQVDETAIALGARLHFPFADDTEWQLDAEVPVQFRVAPDWQLQTGAEASFFFGDDVLGHLAIPVELWWQLARDTYVRVATGLALTDFSADAVRVPFEASTAYTFASALGPVAELSLYLRFPELFAPGADERPVRIGSFEAGVGFAAFFYQ